MNAVIASLFSLVVATTAFSPPPDEAVAPRRIRVFLPFECPGDCVCKGEVDVDIHTSDGCIDVETRNLVLSTSGCCNESEAPWCPPHATDGCQMGSQEYQMTLLGGACTCEEVSWGTGGVEGPQGGGFKTGESTDWIEIGGYGLLCDNMDQGNLSATCIAGGTPVPRTVVNIDFNYSCGGCGE